MFRAHPERAANLFSNIPRLEPVAEIIRSQQQPGATVLHLALELDRKIYRGADYSAALHDLGLSGRFEAHMLDALKSYFPAHEEFDLRQLQVRDLRAGMILERDICDKDRNVLILKEGTILKDMWIERLENFVKARGGNGLIGVRIPRLDGVRKPPE